MKSLGKFLRFFLLLICLASIPAALTAISKIDNYSKNKYATLDGKADITETTSESGTSNNSEVQPSETPSSNVEPGSSEDPGSSEPSSSSEEEPQDYYIIDGRVYARRNRIDLTNYMNHYVNDLSTDNCYVYYFDALGNEIAHQSYSNGEEDISGYSADLLAAGTAYCVRYEGYYRGSVYFQYLPNCKLFVDNNGDRGKLITVYSNGYFGVELNESYEKLNCNTVYSYEAWGGYPNVTGAGWDGKNVLLDSTIIKYGYRWRGNLEGEQAYPGYYVLDICYQLDSDPQLV